MKSVNKSEVVFKGIVSLVKKSSKKTWSGTMTQLDNALSRLLTKDARKVLPGAPSALRVAVNKIVRKLRSNGVRVTFARTPDHARTRLVTFNR